MSGIGPIDESAGGAGAGQAALRRLLERLRDHLSYSEGRAQAAVADWKRLAEQAPEPQDLEASRARLGRERAAAGELTRLADELRVMAEGLQQRLSHATDGRAVALAAMEAEIRAMGERLAAQLAEAEREADLALARLGERLGRWEAAVEAREDRFAAAVAAARLGADAAAAEARELTGPIPEAETSWPAPAQARVRPARRPVRGPSNRSAAALFSAGVGCLGLVALAVVLEPRVMPAPSEFAGPGMVLRGPILIAPPRLEGGAETARAPHSPAPGPLGGPAAERAFADAVRAVEAGRAGGLARLRSLAEAGLPRAQRHLAKLYESGKGGVAADPAEARRWTARAADAGDPIAMHNLALYYLQGRGGPRDDAVAARLLRRAAAAGVADSQFNLALLYETGSGVERNLVEAYMWFQIAANGGDLNARARAVALEERLSPKERASAERVAARFSPGAGEPEEAVLIPGAATIAESQRKLARLGYYIGPTDGQDTPAYRKAVDTYLKDQGARPAAVAAAGP